MGNEFWRWRRPFLCERRIEDQKILDQYFACELNNEGAALSALSCCEKRLQGHSIHGRTKP